MEKYTLDEFLGIKGIVAKSDRNDATTTVQFKKLYYKLYCFMFDNFTYKNITELKTKLNKYIGYFLKSNFYHWRERIFYLESNRTNKQSLEVFQHRYGSMADKFWEEYRKNIAMTEENMIKKYGEKLGKEKWDNYCKAQAETNTFEYKNKKYGMTKEEFEDYNKMRSQTRENMIKRHGLEEGERKWNEYCDKQKYSGCSLEYFQEKYGREKGLEKYNRINFLKSHTLESYIYKYGNEDGVIKYNNHIQNISSGAYASKMSQDFFNELYNKLPDELKEHTYYKNLNTEYGINAGNTYYFYDFVITSINYCLEFNGDYWHCNPEIYKENDIIRYPNNKQVKASDIWERDKAKNNVIKEHNFHLDIVWEKDYNINKSKLIEGVYETIMRIYRMGTSL